MIEELKKELIAIEVIRTLYSQFEKFPEDASNNRNAPFHEAFLNAFADKLDGKVKSIPIFISLSSWMHGLNTSLGQSFLEKTAHILCDGEKKEFTTKKETMLQISENQRSIINNIITDLTNNHRIPNCNTEESECFITGEANIDATDFTVDIFFEDETQIVCIELKTVKPNKSVFKVEKQKILEAKSALKHRSPNKTIKYFLGFPFDPLSDTSTGFDKQRFMDYSVGFRKYYTENEFLLASELWDFLSGENGTMETILSIINAIATVDFLEKYRFLINKNNIASQADRYSEILQSWFLLREKRIIDNYSNIAHKIQRDRTKIKIFNQEMFSDDGCYNEKRFNTLISLI